MKVGDPTYRGEPVPLPVEIVWQIASHIRHSSYSPFELDFASGHGSRGSQHADFGSLLLAQKTLWACCLVCRSWYTASIEHLYNRPLLNNRNFDLFVRTIAPSSSTTYAPSSPKSTASCSSSSSHQNPRPRRRVGLEKLIKHLDMSGLSYESSKSLTARLIRRTKDSLEGFAAPAITFSIPSLAPLSKCIHLKYLDLSTDFYDIGLSQLLEAIHHLDGITTLKLPRNALVKERKRDPNTNLLTSQYVPKPPPWSKWPKNLTHLQLSHSLYEHEQSWTTLLYDSLPSTLKSLRISECVHYSSLQCLWQCPSHGPWSEDSTNTSPFHASTTSQQPSIPTPLPIPAAYTIEYLDLGPALHEDGLPLGAIMHVFRNIKTLVLPAHVGAFRAPLYEDQGGDWMFCIRPWSLQDHPLERLVLRDYDHPAAPNFDEASWNLTILADRFPKLRRIELPKRFYELTTRKDTDAWDRLNDMLDRRRAEYEDQKIKDEIGIFRRD
ncbi:hypothetical protein ABEF95_009789 [Exophiala dermatitidis]